MKEGEREGEREREGEGGREEEGEREGEREREREKEGERGEGKSNNVLVYTNNYRHTLTSLEKTISMYESDIRKTVYRRQPVLSGAGM